MKTMSIIFNPVIERARRWAARGARRSIAWLLVFLFILLPVSPGTALAAARLREKTAAGEAAASPAQATETFVVFGPRRFTREAGVPAGGVSPFPPPGGTLAP